MADSLGRPMERTYYSIDFFCNLGQTTRYSPPSTKGSSSNGPLTLDPLPQNQIGDAFPTKEIFTVSHDLLWNLTPLLSSAYAE
jgi:hypothetical protein